MAAASTAVDKIAAAYPRMASYASDIVRVAKNLDIDPAWLANVINFESGGGNPAAFNATSGASGLIQFMPGRGMSAERLGYTTAQIRALSGKDQMPLVEAYFRMTLNDVRKSRLTSQEDVYMAVFYPVAIGNPDYAFPPIVVAQNNGIRTPRDYTRMANARARLPVSGIGSTGVSALPSVGGMSATTVALLASSAALSATLFWVYRDPIRKRVAQLVG